MPSEPRARGAMIAAPGGATGASARFSDDVAAHAVANRISRAVMYANTNRPSTDPNVAPAGPCMITPRYSDATCLNTSKPTAANRPARTELRKLSGSRGSRAIIQVNSSQEMSSDASSDATCNATLTPEACSRPNQPNTFRIRAPLEGAWTASVTTSPGE